MTVGRARWPIRQDWISPCIIPASRVNTSSRRLGCVFARARATPETRYGRRKGSSANSTRSSVLDETCLIPAVADSSQDPRGSRVIAAGPNFRAGCQLIYHAKDNFFPSRCSSRLQGQIFSNYTFTGDLQDLWRCLNFYIHEITRGNFD